MILQQIVRNLLVSLCRHQWHQAPLLQADLFRSRRNQDLKAARFPWSSRPKIKDLHDGESFDEVTVDMMRLCLDRIATLLLDLTRTGGILI